jgi:hypothetical protein
MRRPNTHVHKILVQQKICKKYVREIRLSACARLTATAQHLSFAYMGISNSTVLVNRILSIRVYNLYRQPSGSKNPSISIESLLELKLFSLNQEGNNTPCMFSPILNHILVFKCIFILKTIQNLLFENLFL